MQIGKRPLVNLCEVWPKETDVSDRLVSADGLALIAEDTDEQVDR